MFKKPPLYRSGSLFIGNGFLFFGRFRRFSLSLNAFRFSHSPETSGADFNFDAIDSLVLQVDILSLKSFNLGMRTAGALSRAASAHVAFFGHIILVIKPS
jgi:hypothetical protein